MSPTPNRRAEPGTPVVRSGRGLRRRPERDARPRRAGRTTMRRAAMRATGSSGGTAATLLGAVSAVVRWAGAAGGLRRPAPAPRGPRDDRSRSCGPGGPGDGAVGGGRRGSDRGGERQQAAVHRARGDGHLGAAFRGRTPTRSPGRRASTPSASRSRGRRGREPTPARGLQVVLAVEGGRPGASGRAVDDGGGPAARPVRRDGRPGPRRRESRPPGEGTAGGGPAHRRRSRSPLRATAGPSARLRP